jgi:hypothetical protein
MTTENQTKKPPTHLIWQVIGENKKSRWIRCGAAWKNKDGKGFLLVFDAYPVTGRTMLRELKDKPSE